MPKLEARPWPYSPLLHSLVQLLGQLLLVTSLFLEYHGDGYIGCKQFLYVFLGSGFVRLILILLLGRRMFRHDLVHPSGNIQVCL